MSYSRVNPPVYSRKERRASRDDTAPRGAADGDTARTRPGDRTDTASSDRIGKAIAVGRPVLVTLFMMSILLPISASIGPVFMMPYRAVLLVLFLPLFFRLVSGATGPLAACDWLMGGATLWIVIALAMNHPIGTIIEPAGVEMVEFFGAYLLGRVGIRNAEEFQTMARTFVLVVLAILPFAIVEAVTHKAILAKITGTPVSATSPRWGLRRVQAVFPHPIHYGTFVALSLGVAWYTFRVGASFALRAALAAAICVSTFVSLSTGALAALMAMMVFIGYDLVTGNRPRKWAIFGWSTVVLYILADFMAQKSVFHTIVFKATFSSGSAYNRILIFEHGMHNVWANPIFGLGNNDWVRPRWLGDSVDNFWLVMALRYGIPEFLMLGGAVAVIMIYVIRAPLTDRLDRACRAGFLVSMIGLIVAGGTVHYWKQLQAFVLFFIGSGVWFFTGGTRAPDNSADQTDASPNGRDARRAIGPRKRTPPP